MGNPGNLILTCEPLIRFFFCFKYSHFLPNLLRGIHTKTISCFFSCFRFFFLRIKPVMALLSFFFFSHLHVFFSPEFVHSFNFVWRDNHRHRLSLIFFFLIWCPLRDSEQSTFFLEPLLFLNEWFSPPFRYFFQLLQQKWNVLVVLVENYAVFAIRPIQTYFTLLKKKLELKKIIKLKKMKLEKTETKKN